MAAEDFRFRGRRAMLILAEMTTAGSLATGNYTDRGVEVARERPDPVMGFVATQRLVDHPRDHKEDFLVFTTGVIRPVYAGLQIRGCKASNHQY